MTSPIQRHELRSVQEPWGTIGVPVRDSINASTAMALMRLAASQVPIDVLVLKGSVLTFQRNMLLQRMRGDWLLFIDDDMQWGPDAIPQLIQTKKDLEARGIFPDILGGLCFRRAAPYQPTMYVRNEEGAFLTLEDWKEDIQDIDGTGMAFAMVTRQCVERLVGGPIPPFEDRVASTSAPDFFKWYGQLGEDLRFCEEVKAAGGRIMVDTRIHVRHIGERAFGYDDYLREMAFRSQADFDRKEAINDQAGLPTLDQDVAMEKYRAMDG